MSAVQIAVEIAGWAGALLILFAYLFLSMGRLTGQSLAYQVMNIAGAAGFVVNGWWHRAIPSAAYFPTLSLDYRAGGARFATGCNYDWPHLSHHASPRSFSIRMGNGATCAFHRAGAWLQFAH